MKTWGTFQVKKMSISVAHEKLVGVFRGNVKFDVKFRNLESMTKKGYQQFRQMKRHNFGEKWMPIKKERSSEILRNSFFGQSKKSQTRGECFNVTEGMDAPACMFIFILFPLYVVFGEQ